MSDYTDFLNYKPRQNNPYGLPTTGQQQPAPPPYDPTTDPMVFNNWVKNDKFFQDMGLKSYEDIDATDKWTPQQKLQVKAYFAQRYEDEAIPVISKGDRNTQLALTAQFRQLSGDPAGRSKMVDPKTGMNLLPDPLVQATAAVANAAQAKPSEDPGMISDALQTTGGALMKTVGAAAGALADFGVGGTALGAETLGFKGAADYLTNLRTDIGTNEFALGWDKKAKELIWNDAADRAAYEERQKFMANGYGLGDFTGDVLGNNPGSYKYLFAEGLPSVVGSMLAGSPVARIGTTLASKGMAAYTGKTATTLSGLQQRAAVAAGAAASYGPMVAGGNFTDSQLNTALSYAAEAEGMSPEAFVRQYGESWHLKAAPYLEKLTEEQRATNRNYALAAGASTALLAGASSAIGGIDARIAGGADPLRKINLTNTAATSGLEMGDEYLSQKALRQAGVDTTGRIPVGMEEIGGNVAMAGLGDASMSLGGVVYDKATGKGGTTATPTPGTTPPPAGTAGAGTTPPPAAASGAPVWAQEAAADIGLGDTTVNDEETGEPVAYADTVYSGAQNAVQRMATRMWDKNAKGEDISGDTSKVRQKLFDHYSAAFSNDAEDKTPSQIAAAAAKAADSHLNDILANGGRPDLGSQQGRRDANTSAKSEGSVWEGISTTGVKAKDDYARTQTAKPGEGRSDSDQNMHVLRQVADYMSQNVADQAPLPADADFDTALKHVAQGVAQQAVNAHKGASLPSVLNAVVAHLNNMLAVEGQGGDTMTKARDWERTLTSTAINSLINVSNAAPGATDSVLVAIRPIAKHMQDFNSKLTAIRKAAEAEAQPVEEGDEVTPEDIEAAYDAKYKEAAAELTNTIYTSLVTEYSKDGIHIVPKDIEDQMRKAAEFFVDSASQQAGRGSVMDAINMKVKAASDREAHTQRVIDMLRKPEWQKSKSKAETAGEAALAEVVASGTSEAHKAEAAARIAVQESVDYLQDTRRQFSQWAQDVADTVSQEERDTKARELIPELRDAEQAVYTALTTHKQALANVRKEEKKATAAAKMAERAAADAEKKNRRDELAAAKAKREAEAANKAKTTPAATLAKLRSAAAGILTLMFGRTDPLAVKKQTTPSMAATLAQAATLVNESVEATDNATGNIIQNLKNSKLDRDHKSAERLSMSLDKARGELDAAKQAFAEVKAAADAAVATADGAVSKLLGDLHLMADGKHPDPIKNDPAEATRMSTELGTVAAQVTAANDAVSAVRSAAAAVKSAAAAVNKIHKDADTRYVTMQGTPKTAEEMAQEAQDELRRTEAEVAAKKAKKEKPPKAKEPKPESPAKNEPKKAKKSGVDDAVERIRESPEYDAIMSAQFSVDNVTRSLAQAEESYRISNFDPKLHAAVEHLRKQLRFDQELLKQAKAAAPAEVVAQAEKDFAAKRRRASVAPGGGGTTRAKIKAALKAKLGAFADAVELIDGESPTGIEAEYDPATGKIRMWAGSINSPARAVFVAWHELHHKAQDAYPELTKLVMKFGNAPIIEKMIPTIMAEWAEAGITLTREQAIMEAAAELSAAMRTGSDVEISERYGAEVNAKGIKAILQALFDGLRKLLGAPTNAAVLNAIRGTDLAHDVITKREQRALLSKTPEERSRILANLAEAYANNMNTPAKLAKGGPRNGMIERTPVEASGWQYEEARRTYYLRVLDNHGWPKIHNLPGRKRINISYDFTQSSFDFKEGDDVLPENLQSVLLNIMAHATSHTAALIAADPASADGKVSPQSNEMAARIGEAVQLAAAILQNASQAEPENQVEEAANAGYFYQRQMADLFAEGLGPNATQISPPLLRGANPEEWVSRYNTFINAISTTLKLDGLKRFEGNTIPYVSTSTGDDTEGGYVNYGEGQINVSDKAFVTTDKDGVRATDPATGGLAFDFSQTTDAASVIAHEGGHQASLLSPDEAYIVHDMIRYSRDPVVQAVLRAIEHVWDYDSENRDIMHADEMVAELNAQRLAGRAGILSMFANSLGNGPIMTSIRNSGLSKAIANLGIHPQSMSVLWSQMGADNRLREPNAFDLNAIYHAVGTLLELRDSKMTKRKMPELPQWMAALKADLKDNEEAFKELEAYKASHAKTTPGSIQAGMVASAPLIPAMQRMRYALATQDVPGPKAPEVNKSNFVADYIALKQMLAVTKAQSRWMLQTKQYTTDTFAIAEGTQQETIKQLLAETAVEAEAEARKLIAYSKSTVNDLEPYIPDGTPNPGKPGMWDITSASESLSANKVEVEPVPVDEDAGIVTNPTRSKAAKKGWRTRRHKQQVWDALANEDANTARIKRWIRDTNIAQAAAHSDAFVKATNAKAANEAGRAVRADAVRRSRKAAERRSNSDAMVELLRRLYVDKAKKQADELAGGAKPKQAADYEAKKKADFEAARGEFNKRKRQHIQNVLEVANETLAKHRERVAAEAAAADGKVASEAAAAEAIRTARILATAPDARMAMETLMDNLNISVIAMMRGEDESKIRWELGVLRKGLKMEMLARTVPVTQHVTDDILINIFDDVFADMASTGMYDAIQMMASQKPDSRTLEANRAEVIAHLAGVLDAQRVMRKVKEEALRRAAEQDATITTAREAFNAAMAAIDAGITATPPTGNDPLRGTPGKKPQASVAPKRKGTQVPSTVMQHRAESNWQRFVNNDEGVRQWMADVYRVTADKFSAKYDLLSAMRTLPHLIHTRRERDKAKFINPIYETMLAFQRKHKLTADQMEAVSEAYRKLEFYYRVMDRANKFAAVHGTLKGDDAEHTAEIKLERESLLDTMRDPKVSPTARRAALKSIQSLWAEYGSQKDAAKWFGISPAKAAVGRKRVLEQFPLAETLRNELQPLLEASTSRTLENNKEGGVLGRADVSMRNAYGFKTYGSTHWDKDNMENILMSDHMSIDISVAQVEETDIQEGTRGVAHFVHPVRAAEVDIISSSRRAEIAKVTNILRNLTVDYGNKLGLEFARRDEVSPLYDIKDGTIHFRAMRVLDGEVPIFHEGKWSVIRSAQDADGRRNTAVMNGIIRRLQPGKKPNALIKALSTFKNITTVGWTALNVPRYTLTALGRDLLTPMFSYAMRTGSPLSRSSGIKMTAKAVFDVAALTWIPAIKYAASSPAQREAMAAKDGFMGRTARRIKRLADAGGYAEMSQDTFVHGLPMWMHELVGNMADKKLLMRPMTSWHGSKTYMFHTFKEFTYGNLMRWAYALSHYGGTMAALSVFEEAIANGVDETKAAAEALSLYDPMLVGSDHGELAYATIPFLRAYQSDIDRSRLEVFADELGIPARKINDPKVWTKLSVMLAMFGTAGYLAAAFGHMALGGGDDDDDIPTAAKLDSASSLWRVYYGGDEEHAFYADLPFGVATFMIAMGNATYRADQGWDDLSEATGKVAISGMRNFSPIQLRDTTDMNPEGVARTLLTLHPAAGILYGVAANKNAFGRNITPDGLPRNGYKHISGFNNTPQSYKDAAAWMYSVGLDVYPESIKYAVDNTPYVGPILRSLTHMTTKPWGPHDTSAKYYWNEESRKAVTQAMTIRNMPDSGTLVATPEQTLWSQRVLALHYQQETIRRIADDPRYSEADRALMAIRMDDLTRQIGMYGHVKGVSDD